MIEQFTAATINTQMGRAVREPGGLAPLAGADVILMQEVQLPRTELTDRVAEETGMVVGSYDDELGLAIAVQPHHFILDRHTKVLQERGLIGRAMNRAPERFSKSAFRLRARGLLALALETPEIHPVTVATVHPTVQLKAASRNAQVRGIIDAVADLPDPLILGGDMNHWPGPHAVDYEMHEATDLLAAKIPGPTFDISKTRYAWAGMFSLLGVPVNAQLDAMLYRGMDPPMQTTLVEVPSDHLAVVTTFELAHPDELL